MTVDAPVIVGDAALYAGDCLAILPRLRQPALRSSSEGGGYGGQDLLGGIDHVITDPPYEDALHEAAAAGRISRTDGQAPPQGPDFAGIDAIRDDAAQAMVLAARGWVLAFTLAEGVRAWRDALQSAGARWDTTLCWVKPDAMPRFNGQGAARGFECMAAAWCGTGHRHWNGGGRRGVFSHNTAKGGHPAAKPMALMMELVALYTRPGDLVCDPFMGSGTTGIACLAQGRRFIGIEIDPRYYDMACERMTAAAAEPHRARAGVAAAGRGVMAAAPEIVWIDTAAVVLGDRDLTLFHANMLANDWRF